jgi:AcrR family transcriptional regulator
MTTRHTQHLILEAAVELFNSSGTSEVSTNRIAEYCGVSRGNLHYHFHSKRELIRGILTRIGAEMACHWKEDMSHPTLVRLAEMFARQALLSHRYRFFYREQSYLLWSDSLLLQRYRDLVRRRVVALEGYFLELDRRNALTFGGNRGLIRSIVRGTWIIGDNWLNSVEFLEQELTPDSIQDGYELILDLFRPYLQDDRSARLQSRAAIRAQIDAYMSSVGRPTRDPGTKSEFRGDELVFTQS